MEQSVKTTLSVGNWKAHGSQALLRDWAKGMADVSGNVILCVPHTLLPLAASELAGIASVGSQDIADHGPANQTGNVTAELVADSGASWTLVGHSERRIMGETDAQVATKLELAAQAGLKPILCVGESLDEREQGQLEHVLSVQLGVLIESGKIPAGLVVAYEPVWAIGTGKAAQAADAQDACCLARGLLSKVDGGDKIAMLYGGSVKPENAADFMAQPDIDGLLVGGASLDPSAFAAISRAVAS